MMAYDFISLKTDRFFHSMKHSSYSNSETAAQSQEQDEASGGTSNLLCYSRGLDGVGECRIMVTTRDNKLVKGKSYEFGAQGVKNVMLKSISH